MAMEMNWSWFWAYYKAMDARQKLEMDAKLSRVDLNGWIKALPPEDIAEVIRYAPADVMLCYLPLLPLKLAGKVKLCRPMSEWPAMNEALNKSGLYTHARLKRSSCR